ncbi:MAG: SPASM domain-containing protein, partial [Spirochaetales bacterium]|nr:SPASM domain-containing protein [Spirochaetales bacterium]
RSTDNLENRLSVADLEKIDRLLIDENEIFKKVISSDDYDQEVEKLFYDTDGRWCDVGISCCCADAYGNVCPCPSWADYNSGNLNTEKLEDIWLNSKNFKYIRSLKKKDFPKCRECEDKAYCSVCMAKNANESPNKNPLDVNDYFCKLSHINRETIEKWRKDHL